jgi:hypothetical protein
VLEKVNHKLLFLWTTVMCWLWATPMAMATDPLPVVTGSDLTDKIKNLVQEIGIPVGSSILFLTVCIVAVQLMLTQNNPQKRADTMSGLLYIAIGGILLGGALFFAGVFYGVGKEIFGA